MAVRRSLLPWAFALTACGILLTPISASAAGGTVYVDDDWAGTLPGGDPDGGGPAVSFGTDAFATVIDALAAAPDRIEVAAGDYAGQLMITADVELVGAGEGTTFLTAPTSPAGYVASWGLNGIVVVDGADAVIRGVTIRGPQNGVAQMVGAHIVGGGTLLLESSTVSSIRDDPSGSAQRGVAVVAGASGGATTGAVTIRDVLITDYQKLGVVIRPGSTGLIEDSVIEGRGAQCINGANGIQLQGTGTVRRTRVLDNRYADAPGSPGCAGGTADAFGIGLFSPTGPTVLEDNTITGNELGIYASAAAGAGAALTVTRNTIIGLEDDPLGNPLADGSVGIYSDWARSGSTFSRNIITRNTTGVLLSGAAEDVTGNAVRDNAVGVELTASPLRFAANAIVGNTAGLTASAASSGGPNWWGCDDGPGAADCDSSDIDYSEPDWLVLTLAVDACQVVDGASVAATASLRTTSSGIEFTDATVPATPVAFTTNGRISVTPAAGTTVDGRLPVTIVGVDPGSATADARADNGEAHAPGGGCAVLTVLAAPPVPLTAAGAELAYGGSDPGTTWWAASTLLAGIALTALAARLRARERRLVQDYARRDV